MFFQKIQSTTNSFEPWPLGFVGGVTLQSVNLTPANQWSPNGSIVVNFQHPLHGRISSYMNLPNLDTITEDANQYIQTKPADRRTLDVTVVRNYKDMAQLLSAVMQFSVATDTYNESLFNIDFNYIQDYNGQYFKDILDSFKLVDCSIYTMVPPGKEKVILYPYAARITRNIDSEPQRFESVKFFSLFGPGAKDLGTTEKNGYKTVKIEDGEFTFEINYKA